MYIAYFFGFITVFAAKFFYYKKEINWVECIGGSIVAGIMGMMIYIGMLELHISSKVQDVELLHGQVLDKKQATQTCQSGWYDYPDSFCTEYTTRTVTYNCRNVYNATTKTSTYTCDTKVQYRSIYNYEVKWFVYTSLDHYEINRIDPQGVKKPARWDIVKIHDPVTMEHSHRNWLLSDNNTFSYAKPASFTSVPAYPRVFDIYNTSLVLGDLPKSDKERFNRIIRTQLNHLGKSKGVNIVMHVTNKDQSYFDSVMYSWRGGKKNDINLFFGMKDGKLEWFNVMTFAKGMNNHDMMESMKTDIIQKYHTNDLDGALKIALQYVPKFNRYEMSNFEDIKRTFDLGFNQTIFTVILSMLFALGLAHLLSLNQFKEQ